MNQELFSKIADELLSINVYASTITEEAVISPESKELAEQIMFCTHMIQEALVEIKQDSSQMRTYDEIVEEWYEARRKADSLGLESIPLSKYMEGYTQVFNVWKKSTQSI
jgi:hypothetical protein